MEKYKELFEFDACQNKIIIGTDEAGRGSGVGAVFASAVYFDNKTPELIESLSLLNDSKKVSRKHREELYEIIKNKTINSTIAVEVDEIERINILNASLSAMKQAVENVKKHIKSDDLIVLVDGNKLIPKLKYPQKYVIKGDGTSASIAGASILAKVERDKYMLKLAEEFPQYGWSKNMGYLTKEHLEAIDKYGVSPYHRTSYLEKHFAKQEQLGLSF
jgi:ribonuclease HII